MQYSSQGGSEIFPVSYRGSVLPYNCSDKNIEYQISKLNMSSDFHVLDKGKGNSEG